MMWTITASFHIFSNLLFIINLSLNQYKLHNSEAIVKIPIIELLFQSVV
jgi:hypothetical protein